MPAERLIKGQAGRQATLSRDGQGRVLLRIRIDRAGNVISRRIEQSSGYSLLDQAVMVAIQNANPVPRVPMAYPGGKMLEFRIPIDFRAL